MPTETRIRINSAQFDKIAKLRHKRSIGGEFCLDIEVVIPVNFRRRK